jgi:hypothetical protein
VKRIKNATTDFFGCPSDKKIMSELGIGALYANLFEKFGKDEMKN